MIVVWRAIKTNNNAISSTRPGTCEMINDSKRYLRVKERVARRFVRLELGAQLNAVGQPNVRH